MNAAAFFYQLRKQITFNKIFVFLFLAGLAVRLYQLDLKLFHHDEAVHAWFSIRLLTEGTYRYDPMFHGPLLYYLTAGMFSLLGASDLAGRIIPALLGSLLIPLLYPLYTLGYLDKKQTLIAALFLAVSPSMIYFSRFLRNDIFIAFFTLLLLVSVLCYFERGRMRYALLAAVAVAGGMCSKENMPIVLAIFAAFLIYAVYSGKLRLPSGWKRDLLVGSFVAVGILALFYSSFGQHPEVLVSGPFEAVSHWMSMHQQERLGGPPYFYLGLLLLYELPILLLAVVATGQFILGSGAIRNPWGKNKSLDNFAEIDLSFEKCDRRREFARFCIYWMLLSLGVYAYLGEKVPWLILHQLLPMIFVATFLMDMKKFQASVVLSVFLVAMSWHVAFVPSDINEPIVQVQNSEDLREVMALIDSAGHTAIAMDHDLTWPLPWYYFG
ncbi:MAG: TIGR03663 family protein, partial [Methanomicrobiaceae archaeon]|nr:TIGR03663 family protein [Methanomicrobiaceae archaeon]